MMPAFYHTLGTFLPSLPLPRPSLMLAVAQVCLSFVSRFHVHHIYNHCRAGTPVASTIASAGHKVVGIDIAPSMVAASQKAVPNGAFSVADMRSYVPPEKVPVVLNMLSLFLLSPQELEVMSHKWSEWLLPGGLLCIGIMAADDFSPTKDMHDAERLFASGMDFRFMGRTVNLTLVGSDTFQPVLNRIPTTSVFKYISSRATLARFSQQMQILISKAGSS